MKTLFNCFIIFLSLCKYFFHAYSANKATSWTIAGISLQFAFGLTYNSDSDFVVKQDGVSLKHSLVKISL